MYDKDLGKMIYNYDSIAKKLKRDSENSICYCYKKENFKFVDLNYPHIPVHTGNLDIVSNSDHL